MGERQIYQHMELSEWCMTFFNLIIAPKKGSLYEDWAQKGKDRERERERERGK